MLKVLLFWKKKKFLLIFEKKKDEGKYQIEKALCILCQFSNEKSSPNSFIDVVFKTREELNLCERNLFDWWLKLSLTQPISVDKTSSGIGTFHQTLSKFFFSIE